LYFSICSTILCSMFICNRVWFGFFETFIVTNNFFCIVYIKYHLGFDSTSTLRNLHHSSCILFPLLREPFMVARLMLQKLIHFFVTLYTQELPYNVLIEPHVLFIRYTYSSTFFARYCIISYGVCFFNTYLKYICVRFVYIETKFLNPCFRPFYFSLPSEIRYIWQTHFFLSWFTHAAHRRQYHHLLYSVFLLLTKRLSIRYDYHFLVIFLVLITTVIKVSYLIISSLSIKHIWLRETRVFFLF